MCKPPCTISSKVWTISQGKVFQEERKWMKGVIEAAVFVFQEPAAADGGQQRL